MGYLRKCVILHWYANFA